MKSSTKALLWEQARVSGVIAAWLLLVVSLGVAALRLSVPYAETRMAQDVQQLSLMLYLMGTFVGATLLILRADAQGHLSIHFEPRHSRLPVPTPTLIWTIFSVRLLFMVLLSSLLWGVLLILSAAPNTPWMPLLPIFLFSVFQALVWSYRTVTWVGYGLATLFLVLPILVAGMLIYEINSGHTESMVLRWVTQFPYGAALTWGVVPGVLLSFLLGWLGVHYTRLDLTCGPPRLSSLLERIGDLFRPEVRRFESPFAAQLWYEWRRIGYLLPMFSVVVLILLVLGITTLLATSLEELPEGESMLALEGGDMGLMGIYAQFTPLLAVVTAALITGAVAIRPKSRFPLLRPLAVRHGVLAILMAYWKSMLLTLAVAMPLSVLGFVLFDAEEVRFLWGHFTAGRVSTPEMASIFLAPLLLTVALAWGALLLNTRYLGWNLVALGALWLLAMPRHRLHGLYRLVQEDREAGEWPAEAGFLYKLMMEYPPWFEALHVRISDVYLLFFIFNFLLLSVFMVQAARQRLFPRRDWGVLLGAWGGLAVYFTVFAPFGFSWLELMLMNLGMSAFLIAPFVVIPLNQLRRRVQ